MGQATQHKLLLSVMLVWLVCGTWSVALSCDSCGHECAASCGTRTFRTCCFNYLRKRSGDGGGSRPGLRLELLVLRDAPRLRAQPQPAEVDGDSRMHISYNDLFPE